MKGQRRFITVHRLNLFLSTNGAFERVSLPVADIKEIEDTEEGINDRIAPWSEVRAKIAMKGKDGEKWYTRESQDELVRAIETPFEGAGVSGGADPVA